MPSPQWNDTRAEYPRDVDIARLMDEHVLRCPDAVALRYQNQTLSYGELRTRSVKLAHHLRSLGVGPGKLVGICTDRSADMLIGLLGILEAGGAYVPLDPGYPPDRLAFMLTDAGVAALVAQEACLKNLPVLEVPTIRLDSERALLDAQSTTPFDSGAGPEDPAYVIYTSGSTGKPKGVVVRRAGLVNFLWAMKLELGVGSDDTVLALTTISFDIAGLELFLPLIAGGCVVLATREDATEADRLIELMEKHGVTLAQATPATWRLLLDSRWPGSNNLQILCGGEAMTRELADRLGSKGKCLWNMYGPTETTVWSTMCRIDPGSESISIGRPIANTQIYILDEKLQQVPVGQVGELYIGGDGLARGYLNRPDLTAERFVPNPFDSQASSRIYRTGDLARYWLDGRIECLGRVDHQVKVRGFRIELPEIEARLQQHPQVKAAAVTAWDDTNGEKYLAAYWVGRTDADAPTSISSGQLRDFLIESLPGHMIPSTFMELKSLPLTPNGKVDRRALPAPGTNVGMQSSGCAAPTTPTERRLVQIWEHLLGVRPIGIRDDFFTIGGHSLAAARLVARIESELSVRMPASTLLSAPTIEQLGRMVDRQTEDTSSGVLVTFRSTGSQRPLFLVAGVGGHVLIFRKLAELLGEDQPVYGLQGVGLDGKEDPLSEMKDIAARYIREIVSIQPEGPYVVGGWSMGGVIAFEIARQLLQQGRELGKLLIIDAYAPWAGSFKDRLAVHLSSFKARPWQSKLRYLGQRLVHQAEVLTRRLGIAGQADGLEGSVADRVRSSSLAQFEALRRYCPEPLPQDAFLLRAEQTTEIRDPRASDPLLGWSRLVEGGVRVMPISGSHTGIFVGENVRTLAASVKACLGSGTPMTGHDSAAAGLEVESVPSIGIEPGLENT